MRSLLSIILFMSIANTSVAGSAMSEKFIGTWLLQNIEAQTENGSWVSFDQLGQNPFGILMYDNAGNMTVQIVRGDRNISDPDDTIAEIVNGYVAYVGTYEIDQEAGTVTHHRIAHINADLDDLSVVRYFQFDDEILTLTVAPDRKLRLMWRHEE